MSIVNGCRKISLHSEQRESQDEELIIECCEDEVWLRQQQSSLGHQREDKRLNVEARTSHNMLLIGYLALGHFKLMSFDGLEDCRFIGEIFIVERFYLCFSFSSVCYMELFSSEIRQSSLWTFLRCFAHLLHDFLSIDYLSSAETSPTAGENPESFSNDIATLLVCQRLSSVVAVASFFSWAHS